MPTKWSLQPNNGEGRSGSFYCPTAFPRPHGRLSAPGGAPTPPGAVPHSPGALHFSDTHTDSRISKGGARLSYTVTVSGSNGADPVSGYVDG